jgi:hypothetical protein
MRASRSAAAALLLAVAAGATACSTTTHGGSAPTSRAASTGRVSMTRALGSCGLSATDAGVTSTRRELHLVTTIAGKPTGVDRADVACTLEALRLPRAERNLFWSTSISGGFQTVSWTGYSAAWHFQDTITFDVEVYPGP